MSLLKQLLGTNTSDEIDAQFEECCRLIKTLKSKIEAMIKGKDEETLSKFNARYIAELKYEESDVAEQKYNDQKPGPTPDEIPKELRPLKSFPISSPDPKGDAKFEIQRCLKGHNDKIYAMKWSSDSQNLVSASQDGSLIVWDMKAYTKKLGIPLRMAWVMTVDYSPNGSLIASAGLDNISSVFNVEDKVGWVCTSCI